MISFLANGKFKARFCGRLTPERRKRAISKRRGDVGPGYEQADNGGGRRAYGAVVAFEGMAPGVSLFGGGKKYASSGLGCAGGSGCWRLK